jgi:hypothetical protein
MKIRVALIALALPFAAEASDGKFPGAGIDYNNVVQYDFSRLTTGGQPHTITSDGYLDITSVAHFRFTPESEIWLGTEISPVVPVPPGQRRWVGGTGLNVTDLNYYYQGHDSTFRIGKYEVPFGRAQDAAPGLYTGNFVSAYDLAGVIGGNYEYRFYTDSLGIIAPAVSTYFADTSVLSKSFFRPSSQARRSDGGSTNTGKFNNYAVVVNWLAPEAIPYLEVQVGYMSNHKGEPFAPSPPDPPQIAANENLRTVSLRYMLPFTSTTDLGTTLSGHYVDIVPFVEYVKVNNEGGVAGMDTSYLTTSLTVDYGRWAYGVTRTYKSIDPSGASRSDEYVAEASVVYHLTGLIDVAVSGGRGKQGGSTSNLFGVAFAFNGAF